jgi:hypothetical protein
MSITSGCTRCNANHFCVVIAWADVPWILMDGAWWRVGRTQIIMNEVACIWNGGYICIRRARLERFSGVQTTIQRRWGWWGVLVVNRCKVHDCCIYINITDIISFMETDIIKTTCIEIKEKVADGQSREVIQEVYADFAEKYPKLFEACLNPDFPLDFLEYMLQMKHVVTSSNMSIDDADKVVYGKLQEKYVTPFIPNHPTKKGGGL